MIGATDEDNLVKPMAFVVLNKGHEANVGTERELKEYVKTTLAHYKFPRWVRFLDELPKTATGKIKRFELRNLVRAETA